MTDRPQLLLAALALCLSLPAGAQTDSHPEWNVLYLDGSFADPERMTASYLSKAREASEAERERIIEAVRTPADLERYQTVTRARLREAMGEFPPRTPLNAKIVGTIERGDYAIEKVIFESRPRYYVPANVYVPRRARPKFPGVIAPVGHWGLGKSFEDYQQLGVYLARRGFLVLVYDLPGQGERLQYYDPVLGRSLISPEGTTWFVTIEHNYGAGQNILTSDNYPSYLVWDGIRAIDYLLERNDVDREKIACTGTSGGGLQTELISAVDERVKVSIPVCYGGCAADTPARPGIGRVDFDALIATRPLLMIEATGDARSGVLAKQRRHEKVTGIYQRLGMGDRTRFLIAEGRHGYVEGMREAAYEWLRRWLNPASAPAENFPEPRTPLESDAALFATTTGQVRSALGGETTSTLNRAEGEKIRRPPLPQDRAAWTSWRDSLRAKVAERIGFSPSTSPLDPRPIARADKGSYVLEKIVYHSEPGIYIPSLLLLPKASAPSPAVVFIHERGKSADRLVENYLRPLAEAGFVTLSIDPRGMGETAPDASPQRNYRGFVHDGEAGLFYQAISVGKTLVGMRTVDVLRGVDYLRTRAEADANRIAAIGEGTGGLLALYAAALDERIQAVAASATLASYQSVLQTEIYTHRFSAFAPRLLRDFDLPDLAALVAPRPLLLINPADQMHRRIAPEKSDEMYRGTRQVFRLLGADQKFSLAYADSAGEIAAKYLGHLGR